MHKIADQLALIRLTRKNLDAGYPDVKDENSARSQLPSGTSTL